MAPWKNGMANSAKIEVPLPCDSMCVCLCVLREQQLLEASTAYSGNWLTLGREEREHNWEEKTPLILLNLIEKKRLKQK